MNSTQYRLKAAPGRARRAAPLPSGLTATRPALDLPPRRRCVFSHVRIPGFDPDRAMHDPVHDRVSVNITAETLMPVFLRILSAEHGRDTVIAAFEELEQHPTHMLTRLIEEPLIDHEEMERRVFAEELLFPSRFICRSEPGLFEIRHPNIQGPIAVLTRSPRERRPKIRFPRPREALKHDVLAPSNESTSRKIRDHTAINAALFQEVEPTQFPAGR